MAKRKINSKTASRFKPLGLAKSKGVVVETTSVGVTKPKKKKPKPGKVPVAVEPVRQDPSGQVEEGTPVEVKKPLPLWAIVLSSVVIAVGISVLVRLLAAIVFWILP